MWTGSRESTSGLAVGGDWSRYQSGCSILATSQGGSCNQAVLQSGSGTPVSISGSVVLPRTQSYTTCTVWKLR